ncbi:hypothetical protein [Leptobacterium sp. I13]|uniref:hypothetical protein n=1 Tax=Leptobacterium meishanense TaxID=3128904 RepID=UPI0030ECD16A
MLIHKSKAIIKELSIKFLKYFIFLFFAGTITQMAVDKDRLHIAVKDSLQEWPIVVLLALFLSFISFLSDKKKKR